MNILYLIIGISLMSCIQPAQEGNNSTLIDTIRPERYRGSDISSNTGRIKVEIELSNAYNSFWPCWPSNKFSVIIRNHSDSTIHFYRLGNSWGYSTFRFELETVDTTYHIYRERYAWNKNSPGYYSVLPHESLVYDFDLVDRVCNETSESDPYGWKGLPVHEYETATIRVIYTLPEEDIVNKLFDDEPPTIMFSDTLISKPIKVKVYLD